MEIFGSNLPAAVQYLLAFVIILALLAGLSAILRRISGGRSRIGFSATGARHRQQRLGIIDAVDIDAHRQLLLLRRDNVEHLVMIGGPNDLLVESGIGRQPYRNMRPLPSQQQPASQGAGGIASEPLVAAHLPTDIKAGGFPGEQMPGDQMPEAPAKITEPVESAKPEAQPIKQPSTMQTAPVMPEPLMPRPPSGARSIATPVAPASSAARSIPTAAMPPVPPGLPPRKVPEKDIAAKAAASQRTQSPAAGMPTAPAQGMPAHITAAKPGAPAPAKKEQEASQLPFGNMTRQLEEALKRPFGAVRPSPVTGIKLDEQAVATPSAELPEPPARQPETAGREAEVVPPFIAPAPVAPIVQPRQVSMPVETTRTLPLSPIRPAKSEDLPASPRIQEQVGDVTAKTFQPVPAEKISEPEKKETSEKIEKPVTPTPGAAKAPVFDLSSLENIEAEFARLLGRTPPSKGE